MIEMNEADQAKIRNIIQRVNETIDSLETDETIENVIQNVDRVREFRAELNAIYEGNRKYKLLLPIIKNLDDSLTELNKMIEEHFQLMIIQGMRKNG